MKPSSVIGSLLSIVVAATTLGQATVIPSPDAQAGAAPPSKSAGGILETRVDALLREWSVRTADVTSLYTEFTRSTDDKVFRKKEVVEGSARYLKPNRGRLDIVTGESPESFVLTSERELWQYLPKEKKIVVYRLPPSQESTQLEEGPIPFLFGTKPEQAKSRYRFELIEEGDKIIHVRVHPKLQEDQANFAWCELWLSKETFLPERMKFLESNQNEVTFVFKTMVSNIEIKASDFEVRRLKGWDYIVKRLDEKSDDPTRRVPRAK